jgi:DNA-binding SARP family transcriptional activator/tetratricopeptide (TPR) repeat protein
MLAVLAAAGSRGVSRERMSELFWPDADPDKARHSLRQALYALRQELGDEVIRPESILSIDFATLSSDISEFRDAMTAHDFAHAAILATGPFLYGFHVPGFPEFARWVDEERGALSAETARALLALARHAEAAGDRDAAAEWWRRLTVLDPLSGRFALGFLKALAARGDRAGALAFAKTHESLVRRELETDSDPEIRRLEAELRALPTPPIVRKAAPVTVPPEPVEAVTLPDESRAFVPVPSLDHDTGSARRRRAATLVGVGLVTAAILLSAGPLRSAFGGGNTKPPTFAVGLIREEGVPDSLRIGGVLTDMLATNLARVGGLSVLANSRLLEVMLPGQDTLVAGYSTAARRAGAQELLQGRLLPGPEWSLALELQRVDLETGLVKGAYRVSASNRYALIDSMTAAIARDLRLDRTEGSVSEATTDSPVAYRLYEEGLRAYHLFDAAGARRLMEAALQEDSTFAMAAYYFALLSFGDSAGTTAGMRALRLAARAPDHQRLLISADIFHRLNDPASAIVAESLVVRYPSDPRTYLLASRVQLWSGDYAAAVRSVERAIVLDSAGDVIQRQDCRICDDFLHLAAIYQWWDSTDAAERTVQRWLRFRPAHHVPWDIRLRIAASRGDTAGFRTGFRRFHESNPLSSASFYLPRYQILAEQYDEASLTLSQFVESPRVWENIEARWLKTIALRNQGRLSEALPLTRNRHGPNDLAEGLIAIELGNPRRAVEIFGARARADMSMWATGVQARTRTWESSLLGMALIAAGDTARVRLLVDTVAYWGQRSAYGRDRRLHHYLRGMLYVAQGRDEDAIAALRLAVHSLTHGFTRINYELGRALLRAGRPLEVIPVVRPALHGDIDGPNLYITRTDLHELLAKAFDQSGQRDSAAYHYRQVERAWVRADPVYHARRDSVRAWLARNGQRAGNAMSASGTGRQLDQR